MMTAKQVALQSTTSLLICLLMASPAYPADLPAGPKDGDRAPEICFPLKDGEGILRVLESYSACQEVVRAGEEALGSCEVRSQALEGRVVEQDRELQDARKVIDDTRKVGEEAVKAASTPWYQRALATGKWIALALVAGYIAGASK